MQRLLAVFGVLASLAVCTCEIHVIGAGMGRTGTLSLQAALEILGYRAHHFVDLAHTEQWVEWAEGRASSQDMVTLIASAGYNATSGDNPTADIFAEQLRMFPNAKVILSVRDTPEKWEASWKTLFNTLEITEHDFSLMFPSFLQLVPLFRDFKKIRARMGTHLGLEPFELTHGWRTKPEGWLAAHYSAHIKLVQSTVPPEKLLTFNVKEGWVPLCRFLGKEVPNEPFPFVNDSANMQMMKNILLVVVYGWIPFLLLLVCCVLRCCAYSSTRRTKRD